MTRETDLQVHQPGLEEQQVSFLLSRGRTVRSRLSQVVDFVREPLVMEPTQTHRASMHCNISVKTLSGIVEHQTLSGLVSS